MAQGIFRIDGEEIVRPPCVAANSIVFAEWSPVYKNSSGFIDMVATNERPYGFITQAYTALSTNQNGTVPQTHSPDAIGYAPRVIAPDNVLFWADADIAWTQTDNDAYCDVASVASGVVTMNLAAGATGTFHVHGLLADLSGDPSFAGDTTKIVVSVAERQDLAYAAS